MQLNIKATNDKKYTVDVAADATIAQLKEAIAQVADVAPDQQRLIYAGRVLKDVNSLETYELGEGHTIHMVRSVPKPATATSPQQPSSMTTTTGATSPQSTTTTTTTTTQSGSTASNTGYVPFLFGGAPMPPPYSEGGMNPGQATGTFNDMGGVGGLPQMEQLMQDPGVQAMMQHLLSNPQFLDSMIQSNPQLASFITPEMRSMMQNPEILRIIMDPTMMRHVSQWTGSTGTGFPTPSPQPSQPPTSASPTPPPTFSWPPQLPPWMMGAGGGGFTQPSLQPQQPPEVRFQSQLQQLNDMGFYDADANIRALLATGGNVHLAVERLLQTP